MSTVTPKSLVISVSSILWLVISTTAHGAAPPTVTVSQALEQIRVTASGVTPNERACFRLTSPTSISYCVGPKSSSVQAVNGATSTTDRRLTVSRTNNSLTVAFNLTTGVIPNVSGQISVSAQLLTCSQTGCQPASDGSSQLTTVQLKAVKPSGCKVNGPTQIREGRGKKQIALTFDDGPGPYTQQVVDILKKSAVTATFFLVGEWISSRKSLVQEMFTSGFELGNHSWSHPSLAGGGSAARNQLTKTQAEIKSVTGFTPCVMRPPYGSTSSALVSVVKSLGLVSVLWLDDPRDWSRPGVANITSIATKVKEGRFIVLHDGGGSRQQTVAALPTIIDSFKKRGYKFVTVSQMMGYKQTYGYAK